MRIISITGALLAALSAVSASAASHAASMSSPGNPVSQTATGREASRAVVLRVQNLGTTGARAIVIRRPARTTTQDIILVTASTRSADLAKAVATLMFSRRSQGAQVTRELRAEIAPAAVPVGVPSKDSRRATRDLERLSRARVININGVGRGAAIGITIAPVVAKHRE